MVRVRGLAGGLLCLRGGWAGFQVAVVVHDGSIAACLLGGSGRSRLLFGGLLLVCIGGRHRAGLFWLSRAGGLGVGFVSTSDVAFGIHPYECCGQRLDASHKGSKPRSSPLSGCWLKQRSHLRGMAWSDCLGMMFTLVVSYLDMLQHLEEKAEHCEVNEDRARQ